MAKIERESINFKLPKKLADVLRTAAKTRNTTATDLVIQGLHHILGQAPGTEGSTEARLHQLETQLQDLANRVESRVDNSTEEKLEQKLDALFTKVAQLEGAIMVLQRSNSGQRSKRSGYPNQFYRSEPPQLQPFQEENLALRLVTDTASLQDKRETLTQQEFIRWCKDRDPSSIGWRYEEKDGLYHPVK
ncbi:MAG: hypothetical protein PUP91_28880 [Rhizonema sp. PD37]|nr:hypothetical protein [Rhizonema sp. PD37]